MLKFLLRRKRMFFFGRFSHWEKNNVENENEKKSKTGKHFCLHFFFSFKTHISKYGNNDTRKNEKMLSPLLLFFSFFFWWNLSSGCNKEKLFCLHNFLCFRLLFSGEIMHAVFSVNINGNLVETLSIYLNNSSNTLWTHFWYCFFFFASSHLH